MKQDFNNLLSLDYLPNPIKKEVVRRLETSLQGLKEIKWPIKAVILAGGYKNKEITHKEGILGSDVDIFVASNYIPFFWTKLKKIEKRLNKGNHWFHYRGVIPILLWHSKTFWAYKLKHEAIVLMGKSKVLERIQATENNITKLEALRILLQTFITWIVTPELSYSKKNISELHILRIYLNIGEAYLTYCQNLRPSYSERLKSFQQNYLQYGLTKNVVEKIILGYQTKLFNSEGEQNIQQPNLSLEKAKKDCLAAITYLGSLLSPENTKVTAVTEYIKKNTNPKPLLNLGLYFFLVAKNFKPRFWSFVFKFHVADFYHILMLIESGNKTDATQELKKYFRDNKSSDELILGLSGIPLLPIMTEM